MQHVDTDKTVAGTTLPKANIRKTIGPITLLAICFNICSSWAGLATSIQIALIQGGPMTLIYGILVSTVIYLGISLMLAELASVYPVAGGQYHFTSILAPEKVKNGLSYVCGWITTFCWIATGAAVTVITAYQTNAVAAYFHPHYNQHSWQVFLIYQAWILLIAVYNIFVIKRLSITHTLGCKS
jgi:choline transport protein